MRALVITIVVLISVGLVHYSYVDFRFRARDGVLWFWLMNPAPTLVWISRGAIAAAAVAALSIMAFGAILPIAIAIVALLIVHIASLVLLEIREG
jgi:hypothetical protein